MHYLNQFIHPKFIFFALGVVATAVLTLFSLIPLVNALSIVAATIIALLSIRYSSTHWQIVLCWLLLVPLAFFSATYRPQGFSYPLLLQLGNGFSMYANFSKGMIGLCLLVILWPTTADKVRISRQSNFLVLIVAPLVVILCAIVLLNLAWQIKPIYQIIVFALANLVLTCIAEEVFMRFLLQWPLIKLMRKLTAKVWLQELVPLVGVTIIFVVIHQGLEGSTLWLYGLAGLVYGLTYTLSKNIIYSISVHCLVNLLHFSFLTYPIN